MRTVTTLIFLLNSLTIFSQCIDSQKIVYGGDWGFVHYIHRCPTYNFTYDGDTSKKWNVLGDPIDINQAPKKVIGIKKYVEDSIRKYSGNVFFARLHFSSVEIVYANKLKEFKDSGRSDVTLKYCKAKYFFYYEFKPDKIATYHIGIAVNKNGKIISPFTFPAKNDYIPVDTNINYCQFISIARNKQPGIDPIKEIKFEFDSKEKRFYWLISQEIVNIKEGKNLFNQVTIDAADKNRVLAFKSEAYIQF